MTTNHEQDVPEPLHTMVKQEPLVMLDDEPRTLRIPLWMFLADCAIWALVLVTLWRVAKWVMR